MYLQEIKLTAIGDYVLTPLLNISCCKHPLCTVSAFNSSSQQLKLYILDKSSVV